MKPSTSSPVSTTSAPAAPEAPSVPVEETSSTTSSNEIDYPAECKGDFMAHEDCDKVSRQNRNKK